MMFGAGRRVNSTRALLAILAFALLLCGVVATAPAQDGADTGDWSRDVEAASLAPDVAAATADTLERVNALWADAREAATDEDAERLADEAIALYEQTWGPNHPALGSALVQAGSTMMRRGRYVQAEAYYRRNRDIAESRLGLNHRDTVIALSILAEPLVFQYRLSEAEALQREALQRAEGRLDALDRDLIPYVDALATTYEAEGLYTRAEPLWRRSLTLRELGMRHRFFLHDTAGGIHSRADALTAIAVNLDHQGRAEEAERHFRFALAVREQEGFQPAIAAALNELGANLDLQERHAEAISIYRRALALHDTMARADPDGKATLLHNLGGALSYLEQNDEAEVMLRAALEARVALYGEDDVATSRTRANLANLLASLGRTMEARQLMQAVLIARTGRLGAEHPDTASVQWGLAALLAEGGRYSEAEPLMREALSTLQSRLGGEHARTNALELALALLYLQSGRTDEAVLMSARARTGFARRRDTLSRADLDYERAIARNLAQAALVETRANWQAGRTRPMNREAAFLASQRAAPDTTTRAFALSMATSITAEEGFGEELAAWRQARETADALDVQVADGASAGVSANDTLRLLSQQADALRALSERTRALAQVAPRFFDLIAPQPVPSEDVRALLGEDEALIQLTPGAAEMPDGKRQGFAFALTREGFAWAEIAMEPDQLATDIGALHAQLQSGGATRAPGTGVASSSLGGARSYDRARALRLYNALFGSRPIARLIGRKSRWTIAPQGVLLSAPFAALVTRTPAGGAGADNSATALRATHWLGLERTLSIAPSVSSLAMQRRLGSRGAMQGGFFGLGDPAFEGDPDEDTDRATSVFFSDRSGDVAAIRRLHRLPQTRREIQRLAQAFGATRDDYVLGNDATERELYRRNADSSLARAEVIVFATHGLVAGDLSGTLAEPALALTPPPDASAEDDGLLTASEAARLHLNARWVILSACNTASGGRPDAEGMTGLARAFFYAGAHTLLVSQWPVNDQAAERLTTRVVELQRSRGLTTAEAMRASMQELAVDPSRDGEGRSYAHPSAWAPFVLVSGE